jgi:hypothetical protein
MHPRWALAFAAFVCAALCAPRARAWQEAREGGDDAYVRIEPDGTGAIAHTLRWHVLHGPLKRIDLAGVDARAAIEPEVNFAADDGRRFVGHASRQADGTVRVAPDDARGLPRGTYEFAVRWRLDLVGASALRRDGGTFRLTLAGLTPSDGFDSARLILDVPAAMDPPQPVVPETGLIDDGQQASLRRGPDRDVLDLVRPHVARDEPIVWNLRIDRRALRVGSDAAPAAVAATSRVTESGWRTPMLAAVLVAVAGVVASLVAFKGRAVRAVCAARGAIARPLIPIALPPRAVLAGLAFASGLELQLRGRASLGGSLVAFAALAAAHRRPTSPAVPKGPGRWLVLRPEDAFAPPSGADDWLDVGTRAGRWLAVGFFGALVVGAFVATRLASEAVWTLLLDLGALLPLGLTGRASQLPPQATATGPWLASAYRRLSGVDALRVAPWARVVVGGGGALDELRLIVAPRASLPGFVGVELGLAWSPTPVGWASSPEVLVRVLDGSAASAKLARCLPGLPAVPGRRPEERVVRLLPVLPTRKDAVALTRGVAEALVDKRLPGAESWSWAGPERRRAPGAPSRQADPAGISALPTAC